MKAEKKRDNQNINIPKRKQTNLAVDATSLPSQVPETKRQVL